MSSVSMPAMARMLIASAASLAEYFVSFPMVRASFDSASMVLTVSPFSLEVDSDVRPIVAWTCDMDVSKLAAVFTAAAPSPTVAMDAGMIASPTLVIVPPILPAFSA